MAIQLGEWELPDPFAIDLVVHRDDIDQYGHTNNTVYLKWCEQVSWAHSEAVGIDWADYQRLHAALETGG